MYQRGKIPTFSQKIKRLSKGGLLLTGTKSSFSLVDGNSLSVSRPCFGLRKGMIKSWISERVLLRSCFCEDTKVETILRTNIHVSFVGKKHMRLKTFLHFSLAVESSRPAVGRFRPLEPQVAKWWSSVWNSPVAEDPLSLLAGHQHPLHLSQGGHHHRALVSQAPSHHSATRDRNQFFCPFFSQNICLQIRMAAAPDSTAVTTSDQLKRQNLAQELSTFTGNTNRNTKRYKK